MSLLNNYVFLSKGLQLGLLVIALVVFLCFQRVSQLEEEVARTNARLKDYLKITDYFETFDVLYADSHAFEVSGAHAGKRTSPSSTSNGLG